MISTMRAVRLGPANESKRLLMVVNSASFFLSHRLPVALAARQAGLDVHVATAPGAGVDEVEALGFAHHPLPLSRSGVDPVRESRAIWAHYRLFRHVRPGIVHLVTIKPVLYGGVAARLARVPGVVAAISGLGFVFTDGVKRSEWLRWPVRWLYRRALGHRNVRVIVQNTSDLEAVRILAGLGRERFRLLPGSGVDLERYTPQPEADGTPVVMIASRMLADKGINEFVEGARALRARGVAARFVLVGTEDEGNPASIPARQLEAWHAEGGVEWWGYRTDIAETFARAHLVVLPSYYGEGLPRVLIEAAACGRAVITTDMPGCRDAIKPGVTGLLVPPRDAGALANAIEQLVNDPERRRTMGQAARCRAETVFPVEKIADAHLDVYRELLGGLRVSNA